MWRQVREGSYLERFGLSVSNDTTSQEIRLFPNGPAFTDSVVDLLARRYGEDRRSEAERIVSFLATIYQPNPDIYLAILAHGHDLDSIRFPSVDEVIAHLPTAGGRPTEHHA